jgi:hypothetical protein
MTSVIQTNTSTFHLTVEVFTRLADGAMYDCYLVAGNPLPSDDPALVSLLESEDTVAHDARINRQSHDPYLRAGVTIRAIEVWTNDRSKCLLQLRTVVPFQTGPVKVKPITNLSIQSGGRIVNKSYFRITQEL